LENKYPNFNEVLWECIKQNISNLSEIDEWYNVVNDSITIDSDRDTDFLKLAEQLLPNEPWNESTWDNWISVLKKETSKSGKDLFLPLRLAITGKSRGPELNKLILLIGYNEIKNRLLSE
jgi:glutamyl-tRNA synthetase